MTVNVIIKTWSIEDNQTSGWFQEKKKKKEKRKKKRSSPATEITGGNGVNMCIKVEQDQPHILLVAKAVRAASGNDIKDDSPSPVMNLII